MTAVTKRRGRATWRGMLLCTLLAFGMDGQALAQPASDAPVVHLALDAAAFAPQKIKIAIYLPPGYADASADGQRYPVLYANDGQDMSAVGLQDTLDRLYAQRAIGPVIVVAVDMLADRASGYGLSDRARRRSVVGGSRIGPIGLRAFDYSDWLATQLVPYVDAHYRTQANAAGRTILGWSLGGLHAFNLGWNYPDVFGRVGAFSPSFWLAADRSSAQAVESSRLAQAMVDRAGERKPLRLWLSVGGREETNDRNGNGVIDAVEDVQDLIDGVRLADGTRLRGLRDLGYRVSSPGHAVDTADVTYRPWPDGEHNQATWKRMLPEFLVWAFGPNAN